MICSMGKDKSKRQYKDSVFVDLLTIDKKNTIDVYNALNHTTLSKETSIEFINIESSLYSTIKNKA